MKNVLLLVHDDAGQESRLQAALDLTRALQGHLTCLDVTSMPAIVTEPFAFDAAAILIADEREREAANRARLESRLRNEDVSWDWVDVTGGLSDAVIEASCMADLIVVSRRLESTPFPDMRGAASEVILESGKAVVAVPEDGRGFDVTGPAMIAWDGSKEAMKALQSAEPLLELAEKVTILEVDDRSIAAPAEEAAIYLSRHGVSAEIVRRENDLLTVGDIILAEAKQRGATYVVMGGFGHSRIVEALTGGVSREMLTESPIPTVIRH